MKARRFETLDPFGGLETSGGGRLAAARQREDERWRRARGIGIVGTAVLHLIVLLLTRTITIEPMSAEAAAGPAAGDLRAAEAGGSGMTMVEIRAEQAPVQEEVPEPIPIPEEVIIPQEVVAVAPVPAERSAPITPPSLPGTGAPGQGGQDGPAAGPGTSTGDGAGGGGTSDDGVSRVIPPTPRGIFIPPPGRPASARGQEITVWVFVTENGRVDRDQVRLEPPTSDQRYNRRLIQSVGEWVFDPARQNGRPVSVWYPFQVIL